MSKGIGNVLFAIIFAGFAWLHLQSIGAIGETWDEASDLDIVKCLARTHNPFACLNDISQTRLPFYIHAFVAARTGEVRPHYLVSFCFAMANLLLLYVFAR